MIPIEDLTDVTLAIEDTEEDEEVDEDEKDDEHEEVEVKVSLYLVINFIYW